MIPQQLRDIAAVTILCLAAANGHADSAPRIAIIIDDLGYQLAAGQRAIALPGPVVCAILPGTPVAASLAKTAYEQGKEILLHLPLQAMANHPPEPDGITLDMSRQRFSETFTNALESVPFATGINSHRGSLLTRHPGHMRWLMEDILAADDLFFVDSYTTHQSVALQVASEEGVPAIKRDVFLDSNPARLADEFARLKMLAREHGLAVAIGHPYPATLAFLEHEIPRLVEEGIRLVPLRELIEFPR